MVVELSRNKSCKDITIVGDEEKAIERMYTTLCQVNQWTALTERIVQNLSVTVDGRLPSRTLDITDTFPYRVSDITIPVSNGSFVYCLVSTVVPSVVYVGQTQNLGVRLNEHNRGYGSLGTSYSLYQPWAVAAYLTGMSQVSVDDRLLLEKEWQRLNSLSAMNNRVHDIGEFIANGETVKNRHNALERDNPEKQITYVKCIEKSTIDANLMEVDGGVNDVEEEQEQEQEEEQSEAVAPNGMEIDVWVDPQDGENTSRDEDDIEHVHFCGW